MYRNVKISICFLGLILISEPILFGQVERGKLLTEENAKYLRDAIKAVDGDLEYIRNISHLLTDNDILIHGKRPVPPRKKAFIRHVKHIHEKLEQIIMTNDKTAVYNELLVELLLIRESFINKIENDAKGPITSKEIWEIGRNMHRSKKLFRYKSEKSEIEAVNVLNDKLASDPDDSPYWHAIPDSVSLEKRFSQLANLKKIKIKEEMVLVFDKSSTSGSAPKVDCMDLDYDNGWSLKWGDEVHTDIAGSRIFAALGYDVDHPYFFGKDKLTLIFDEWSELKNADDLIAEIKSVYKVDLKPFISGSGIVTGAMATKLPDLKRYIGKNYLRFKKCAIEARPDRVKRIGSFMPNISLNENRRELRGSVLAHQFIGNWDTRENNTLLTIVHMGKYRYRISAVFSDLGTSFGVKQHSFPTDFKVGLVNEFDWEVAELKNGKIRLKEQFNAILNPYRSATYIDLLWMAKKIAALDEKMLRQIVKKAHWPKPIGELYFHKLASRRASILKAFEITDPHPIKFDKKLTIVENGITIIKNGKLVVDHDLLNNPEGFLGSKGRLRNYGH